MRAEFIDGLISLAQRDNRVVVLTADLGFGVMEPLMQAIPDRFINVGVAEQAMIGVATGLAEAGKIPYCYSIASFSVARTFEFLRNGPIAHKLPVRLIGVGPGMDYSYDGFTHFAVEDIGLLIGQPNTEIVAPASGTRARDFAQSGSDFAGLVYYRLARNGPEVSPHTSTGGSRDGVLLVAVGDAAVAAEDLWSRLAQQGVAASLRLLETISASSIAGLADEIAATDTAVVAVVESHYVRGGVGTFLGDELLGRAWRGRLFKYGVEVPPLGSLGSRQFVTAEYMTDPDELTTNLVSAYLHRDDLR